MMLRISIVLAACLFLVPLPGLAQKPTVEVKEAWIRGTVPGQKTSGAYMDITSRVPARLAAAATPVAGAVEIHNMKMEGGVMKMSAVDGIELPANRLVKLSPGGYHLMMLELKQTLKAGDRVPLTLTVELAGGKRETLALTVEVRAVTGEPKHAH